MYTEDFETICIVINQENIIEYSNINNQIAWNYIRKMHILSNLPLDSLVQYTLNNYCVTIDKFNISEKFYFIITINPKILNCSNCHKALIDMATGLYNRNYLEQVSRTTFYYQRVRNLSLIFIDIDNLKIINDIYGHLKGDRAIEIVGQAIRKSIRKEDIGVRYGGDEFVILLFNQKQKATYKVIERIRKELSEGSIDEKIDIQISVGVAYTDNLNSIDEMLKIADRDLYREKKIKKEKNRIEINNIKNLKHDIEKMRDELNRKVLESGKGISSQETLKLSQKLDELIVNYFKIYNR